MDQFEVTFYGTRGSAPAIGPDFCKYGGNTACVSLEIADRLFILDGGTGIIPLGQKLKSSQTRALDIFITHGHYDHIQGLPFFAPFMMEEFDVTIWYAGSSGAEDSQALLDQIFQAPFLPFSLKDIPAKLHYKVLPKQGHLILDNGVCLKTMPLNHPGGCTGLRFEAYGQSFVYAPDFENDDGLEDAQLEAFLSKADFAVLDATHTSQDYPQYQGFGHTSWEKTLEIAQKADLARWAFFHHHHRRTDLELDEITRRAHIIDDRTIMAKDGDIVHIFPKEAKDKNL